MKNPIKFLKILLVCVFIFGQPMFAQPIHEAEVFNPQIILPGASHSAGINITTEALQPESAKYEIEEIRTKSISVEARADDMLPALSDMLNRDVQAKADASFESLRRNSAFSVETTLVSRFLGFATTRKSA